MSVFVSLEEVIVWRRLPLTVILVLLFEEDCFLLFILADDLWRLPETGATPFAAKDIIEPKLLRTLCW